VRARTGVRFVRISTTPFSLWHFSPGDKIGKRPYKHGIHGFSEPDPVTGGIRPVTNLSRKTKAIWNILNQNGLNTITIGWWPSNPVEELSKGIMSKRKRPRPYNWGVGVGTHRASSKI
jgi:hypothetical protein